jgi:hypothetical protein
LIAASFGLPNYGQMATAEKSSDWIMYFLKFGKKEEEEVGHLIHLLVDDMEGTQQNNI